MFMKPVWDDLICDMKACGYEGMPIVCNNTQIVGIQAMIDWH